MIRALIFLLLCGPCLAANKYVRQGASGTASGDDWTNAYPDLPSTNNRGDTVYVADGTYGGETFDDAESGTTVITIKKATVADHGTSTGWDNTYGDGRATFTGGLTFSRDYYVIDGATRNESDWSDASAYGFRGVDVRTHTDNAPGGDQITVRYMEMGGTAGTAPGDGGFLTDAAVYFVRTSGGTFMSGATVSRCFIHNSTLVQLNRVDGFTIEYCHFEDMYEKECIRGAGKAKNGKIRFNIFKNTTRFNTENGTGVIALWDDDGEGSGAFDGNEIYGNIIWDTTTIIHTGGSIIVGGNGSSWVGVSASNTKIFNNTIVGLAGTGGAGILVNGGTGNEIRNTIWYNCLGTPTASANTTSNNGEEGSDPFVNLAGGNFAPSAGIAGTDTSGTVAGNNTDLLGNTRGADGTWDRGALEFGTGGGEDPTGQTVNGTTLNAGQLNISP